MYAEMDEKIGEAVQISKPIPLPALNIKYSFKYYQCSMEKILKIREALNNPKWRPPPLLLVNAMVTHGRVELLAHPLSQKYLQMKWNSYGKYFHVTNLLIYTVFLMFVTIYASQLMNCVSSNNRTLANETKEISQSVHLRQNMTTTTNNPLDTAADSHINVSSMMLVSSIAIIVYVVLNSMREVLQIYQQKWKYLFEPNNLVSWLLYISAVLMVSPVFNDGSINDVHFSATSLAVFLSWFNLLLFLQRFDQVGIYVVMFLEILQTLIKVLLVFSILIIAFGLAFYIVLSNSAKSNHHVLPSGNHLSFSTIPMSLIRTFSMMLGEMDFVGTYVQPYYYNELPLPISSFILLGLFMVLMPILLMNLLIGLAVGDIESVRRNAQLKRLAMQVVLHTELERKLPQIWLERVDKMELIEYPNNQKCKLGIFDIVLRKWFCNPFNDDTNLDMNFDSNEELISSEMEKQRKKLRDMGHILDQQHQLLRLIIQKMEIKSEADDVDEGVSPSEFRPLSSNVCAISTGSRWTSPRIRKKLKHMKSFSKGS